MNSDGPPADAKERKSGVHVAVFGDVHGHLRLMFQLCRLWQLEHRVQLDGVLLCGDLGFFPNLSLIDKATRRFAARDPEELGFTRFFLPPESPERDPLLERILLGDPASLDTLVARVLWCHGNHEDFEELSQYVGSERVVAVDRFGVLEWIRSGAIEDLAGFRVAAVGGGPEGEGFHAARTGNHGLERIVTQRACDDLRHESWDVLLTHAGPDAVPVLEASGSALLSELLSSCQPVYHFYAHHSGSVPPASIGKTRSIWLADVNFQGHSRSGSSYGKVTPGCMGILEWAGRDQHEFRVVDEPWFHEVTASNWNQL